MATGGAAAPFLGAAGAAIGAMGGAATSNRGEEDRLNLNRDSIGLAANNSFERAHQDRAQLDLDRREEARTAEKEAFASALRSALAMNMQDVSVDRSQFKTNVPTISFGGGARPSALGPQGREAAALMNNSSLQKLMAPQEFSELPPVEKFTQSEPSKASIWERLAGPVGMGLTIAGQAMAPPPAAQPPIPTLAPSWTRPPAAPIAGMPLRPEDVGDFTIGHG